MKTIFKNGEYDRVDNETADSKVRSNGWKFAPKSEWKTNVRDFDKAAKAEKAKAEKLEKERLKNSK